MDIQLASVIICTYNRADMLTETMSTLIDAVVAYQKPAEILIVNNNSTDATDDIVNRFIAENPSIDIRLLHEQQMGISIARNTAIAAAKGDILCFLDDDIIVSPGWLTGLLEAFSLDENVGCVAGQIKLHWPSITNPKWMDDSYFGFYGLYCQGDDAIVLERGNGFFGGNFAIRREMSDRVGLFNTALGRKKRVLLSGEDGEYSQRIWEHGYTIAYSANGMIYHKVSPDRITYRWLCRRYFWQGVTSYAYKPPRRRPLYPLRQFPKLIGNILLLLASIVIINQHLFYRASFRIMNAFGPYYGWYLSSAGLL